VKLLKIHGHLISRQRNFNSIGRVLRPVLSEVVGIALEFFRHPAKLKDKTTVQIYLRSGYSS
jgi:hypothetical protein